VSLAWKEWCAFCGLLPGGPLRPSQIRGLVQFVRLAGQLLDKLEHLESRPFVNQYLHELEDAFELADKMRGHIESIPSSADKSRDPRSCGA